MEDIGLEEDSINIQAITGSADMLQPKKAIAALRAQVKVEPRGMLVVTTFCNGDKHLLDKRIEWFQHIGVDKTNDLLLVADRDISQEDLNRLYSAHLPFFKSVYTRKIVDSPKSSNWPDNVNHAFRRTYRILRGQYGGKQADNFNWNAYHGWFNFEPDVILLTKDALPRLEATYRSGFNRNPTLNKPFCGYVSETHTNDGKIIRHLNGAAVYPTKEPSSRYYNAKMLLQNGVPWDVAGLSEATLGQSTQLSSSVFINAFGTHNYRKSDVQVQGNEFIATQKLHNGQVTDKKYAINGQIIHHGCKDGSLIDILMGKKKEIMTETNENTKTFDEPKVTATIDPSDLDAALSRQVKVDKAAGLKWTELISKYKVSPKKLKSLLA